MKKQLELFGSPTPKQLWLLNFKNPLLERLGREFFAAIPKAPGVYRMLDERGQIIYVGKAKRLRDRLRSYTHAHAENSSRKTLRLIHAVRSIEWEVLADEKAALLRENHLLRTLKPFFNVANTAPHTYLFVHLRLDDEGVRIHLDMSPDESYPDIYGAFKSLGLVYETHKALLRLLWMSFHPCRGGFELPATLTNRRKLAHARFSLPKELEERSKLGLYRNLKRFFNGTGRGLLDDLVERLLAREDLAAFTREVIQADLRTLIEFYRRCAKRNRRVKRELKIKDPLLPQEKIDDFFVLLGRS